LGKEGDEVVSLIDGRHCYNAKNIVEYSLVFHQSYFCFEMVIFTSSVRDKVWARFYIHQITVFEKIKESEFERLFQDKKEFYRKRHRHITSEALEDLVRKDIASTIIQQAIPDLINYEVYQHILNQPVELISDTILDLFGNPAEYKAYDLASITLLSTKPDCLVPVNVERIHMNAKYKQFLQSERLRKQVLMAVNILQSNLKAKPMKIAYSRSNSRSNFFDFSGVVGSIRASFSGMSSSKLNVDATNHSKYPLETPNNGVSERIRRTWRDMFTTPTVSGKYSTPSFPLSGSSKVQPVSLNPDAEVSSAKRRWLMATNKVIHRNMHEQVTEVLRRKSLLEPISTNSDVILGEGASSSGASSPIVRGVPEAGSVLNAAPASPQITAASTFTSMIGEEVKVKPVPETSSLGRRLMSWTGMGNGSSIVNSVKLSPPSKSIKRDPSTKSIASNATGSSQQSGLRKFKTQYPLSHQVAAVRQQSQILQSSPQSLSTSTASNASTALHRHAQQSLGTVPTSVPIIAEP
jgi:hypothetical protein